MSFTRVFFLFRVFIDGHPVVAHEPLPSLNHSTSDSSIDRSMNYISTTTNYRPFDPRFHALDGKL